MEHEHQSASPEADQGKEKKISAAENPDVAAPEEPKQDVPQLIQTIEDQWKQNPTRSLEEHDKSLRSLYFLCAEGADTRNAKERAQVYDAIRRMEKEVTRYSAEAVRKYLDAQIEQSRQGIRKEKTAVNLQWLTTIGKDAEEKLAAALSLEKISRPSDSARLPRKEGNDWIHDAKDPDGKITRWKFETAPNQKDLADEATTLLLRCTSQPDLFIPIGTRDLLENLHNLDAITEQAMENYNNEQKNKPLLKAYDLPQNEKILHIRVFPEQFDAMAGASLQASGIHVSLLRSRYRNMQAAPLVFSDNPLPLLEKQIAEARKEGCTTFCIDLYEHGLPSWFSGGGITFKEKPIRAQDLIELTRKFNDCTLNISTVACFGGDLRKGIYREIASDPTLAKRLNVFLQTKPNVVNMAAKRGEIKKTTDDTQYESLGPTNYHLFFLKGLLDGKTYGEASWEADRKAKEWGLDAEAIINGVLISRRLPPDSVHTERAA